jgi:hypothetical protein
VLVDFAVSENLAIGLALDGWCCATLGWSAVSILGSALPILGLVNFSTECLKSYRRFSNERAK